MQSNLNICRLMATNLHSVITWCEQNCNKSKQFWLRNAVYISFEKTLFCEWEVRNSSKNSHRSQLLLTFYILPLIVSIINSMCSLCYPLLSTLLLKKVNCWKCWMQSLRWIHSIAILLTAALERAFIVLVFGELQV